MPYLHFFNKGAGKIGYPYAEKQTSIFPNITKKISTKWIKGLYVRTKATRRKHRVLGGQWIQQGLFWTSLQKLSKQKKKTDKWDYIKLHGFCTAKEIIN
jgi:hypothetical protein